MFLNIVMVFFLSLSFCMVQVCRDEYQWIPPRLLRRMGFRVKHRFAFIQQEGGDFESKLCVLLLES